MRLFAVIFLRVVFCALIPCVGLAEEARFFRGINLNGPAVTIDGHEWEGAGAKDFSAKWSKFENQEVSLRPPTDAGRTRMIRSSVWGDKVELELSAVPPGTFQIFLYVWEDNNNERFSVLVNGKVVVEDFESGTAGMWKRLGPFAAQSVEGRLTVSARAASHGAANLSGLEVWAGDGPVPAVTGPKFAGAPTAEQADFFERKIRPVLADHCYRCHSAERRRSREG